MERHFKNEINLFLVTIHTIEFALNLLFQTVYFDSKPLFDISDVIMDKFT